METNRQRRGTKAKLGMSLYRAPKSSSMPYSSKVKSSPTSSMASSLGFAAESNGFIPSALNRKASMLKKEGGTSTSAKECVDSRAATYITYVQERFRQAEKEYDIEVLEV
ncbi:hypothetical protein KSP39_PZI022066 [Platanthera zijinensis]|uniref:Uncharacterized protein n=1 Tax=Platanthera zijinensis TaxID=2320716 RepID=A0AAP0AXY1_9ASPA